MSGNVRWGILGTGTIANKFAEALAELPGATLLAVGSRSAEPAGEFAERHGVPRPYGSYAELVGDADVDVVYVATPHSHHREHCLLCLDAGKAVLCEKPFTTTAAEAGEVIAAARRNGLFCMEAMWMRFHPLIREVRNRIEDGSIGDVCMLRADVGYPHAVDRANRLFDPELGGGALLDLGIYPVSLAFHLLGAPDGATGRATIGETGVDEQASLVLGYPDRLASLTCSFRSLLSNEALVLGTRGQIRIHAPLFDPSGVTLTERDSSGGLAHRILDRVPMPTRLRNVARRVVGGNHTRIEPPARRNGLAYEAEEVMRCLRQGETESPLMPLDESLRIIETLDAVRSQWVAVPRA